MCILTRTSLCESPSQEILGSQTGSEQEAWRDPTRPDQHSHYYEGFPPFVEQPKPKHFPVTEAFQRAIRRRRAELKKVDSTTYQDALGSRYQIYAKQHVLGDVPKYSLSNEVESK